MKYKNRIKMKRYFVYTSITFYLYFLTFSEMKYISSILQTLKRNHSFRKSNSNILHKFRNSTSSIFQSFKMNTSILKVCFNYTSEFKDRYISFENQLQTYF